MSTIKERQTLLQELETAVRLGGNLNVLLVNAIASHVGLSATEFECCSALQDDGPMTAGELAKRCGITTGGMTGLIDRLVNTGCVQRKTDPTDRRRVIVSYNPDKFKEATQKVIKLYAPLQRGY